jgi:pimeloyl-ACP methyl ester carboxylesterase
VTEGGVCDGRANVPRVAHRFVAVDGVRVFYREAGPPDAPTMLLLHGFPSASHQFRRLIDALGGRYQLIAPLIATFLDRTWRPPAANQPRR